MWFSMLKSEVNTIKQMFSKIKDIKTAFITIGGVFVLTLIALRDLLMNITQNLPDWFDVPYITWTMYQNIWHIKEGKFINGFFNTHAFYPFQNTLLFSDILLPQSVIALLYAVFTDNPILVFNLTLFSILFLNIIAAYILSKKITNSPMIVFFSTLIIAFSPYTFLSFGHFQMITVWPILLIIAVLLERDISTKKGVLFGVLLSIQFLASVYLAIFAIFAIAIRYGLLLLTDVRNKKIYIQGLIAVSCFVIVCGPFIYKYTQTKKQYNITREYHEYVAYSAHITDYLFSTHYNSVESNFPIVKKFNLLNNHTSGESAGFSGFLLLFLSLGAIIPLVKRLLVERNKKNFFRSKWLQSNEVYFLTLGLVGFIFSLGPRLNFNGSYVGWYLPYIIMLKLNPLVEVIRANARWAFFLFLALGFFAIARLNAMKFTSSTRRFLVIILLVLVYIVEIFPVTKNTEAKNFYPEVYSQSIAPLCNNYDKVLLEYPLTENKKDASLLTDLTYRTQLMLASVKHECIIVNGYSGYFPEDYIRYEREMNDSIKESNKEKFWKLIQQREVDIIKLNKDKLFPEWTATVSAWLKENPNVKTVIDTPQLSVVKIGSNRE